MEGGRKDGGREEGWREGGKRERKKEGGGREEGREEEGGGSYVWRRSCRCSRRGKTPPARRAAACRESARAFVSQKKTTTTTRMQEQRVTPECWRRGPRRCPGLLSGHAVSAGPCPASRRCMHCGQPRQHRLNRTMRKKEMVARRRTLADLRLAWMASRVGASPASSSPERTSDAEI